jgi:uncharacterized protein DUF397
MPAFTSWRKSSYSDQGGSSCVEVAFAERDGVSAERAAAVRDSKNADGPILVLPALGWRGFVAGVTATVGGRP